MEPHGETPAAQERVWHSCYPSGIARQAPTVAHQNIGELVRAAAKQFDERPAATIVLPNGLEASLTFSEIDSLSDDFAAYLQQELQLPLGERVAILLPNCLAYPICAFGALKAGMVVVNTNPLYTPRELELQLKDSGAKVLVVLDKFGEKLEQVVPRTQVRTVVTTSIGDFFPFFLRLLIASRLRLSGQVPRIGLPTTSLRGALRSGMMQRAKARLVSAKPPPPPGPNDLAALQYTGGTTGASKGAMLTHGNLLANVAQIREITRPCLNPGEETALTVLPLYHVFAFTLNLLFGFHLGSHNVLVPNPRPMKNLKPAFRAHAITWTTGVNTLLKALMSERWFKKSPPRMKAIYAGGTSTQPAVLQAWEQMTGALVIEGYGLSEASPLVTYNPAARDDAGSIQRTHARVGGVGLPLPGTDVRIASEDGQPVATGEPGEILVRGPQVMQGYWKQPEETARVLAGGWLHTGDIGRFDETGYIDLTDRKKDMIIVSGFKVFPNEVEACIAIHPEVADVAVVGVPDEDTGEAVRAYVVPKSTALTAESIREHCRALLVNYKIPRSVSFLVEMPKNSLGKTLRRELRTRST